MKPIVKIIIIILSWLLGKKNNSNEPQNSATTTDDPERTYNKMSDLLKVICQKENEDDIYRIILGKSIAINRKFKTSVEAYKWIAKVDSDMMELTMTIAKEIYDVEKTKQERENIHKESKPNKA